MKSLHDEYGQKRPTRCVPTCHLSFCDLHFQHLFESWDGVIYVRVKNKKNVQLHLFTLIQGIVYLQTRHKSNICRFLFSLGNMHVHNLIFVLHLLRIKMYTR